MSDPVEPAPGTPGGPVEHDVPQPAEATAAAAPAVHALPERPHTGNPRVDAALQRLDDVRERPAADHVEIYEDVHRRLQEALADPDGG